MIISVKYTKTTYLLLFTALLFISVTSKQAYAQENFSTYLASAIYESCKGKDIYLNQDSILRFKERLPNNQIVVFNKVGPIVWPYSETDLYYWIEKVIEYAPYPEYLEFPDGKIQWKGTILQRYDVAGISFTHNGKGLINCENKYLDVNGGVYFWDGKKMELPNITQIAENNTNSIINQVVGSNDIEGDLRNTSGSSSDNKWFNNPWLVTIGGGLILLVFGWFWKTKVGTRKD